MHTCAVVLSTDSSRNDGFVRAENSTLTLDGEPWRCVGGNSYYLLTHAAEESLRPSISGLLDRMASSGMSLLRTWAFNDGPQQWNALQTAPGVYSEKVFRGLDWLVAECKAKGIRLLLSLVNYWSDYGGLQQYIRWSQSIAPGHPCPVPEVFYVDTKAQQMLLNHVTTVVMRKNTVTGLRYSEDPTILGWELINEPRCEVLHGIDASSMRQWIAQGLKEIKRLAPRQLTTVGFEGFWGNIAQPESSCRDPVQGHGCNWTLDCDMRDMDFVSFHLYPDHWLPPNSTTQQVLDFTCHWLTTHAHYARDVLDKPIMLTEFGTRLNVMAPHDQPEVPPPAPVAAAPMGLLGRLLTLCFGTAAPTPPPMPPPTPAAAPAPSEPPRTALNCHLSRDAYCAVVLDTCFGVGFCGALIWMLAARDYADYDGFTVYPPVAQVAETASEAEAQTVHDHDATWQILTDYATKILAAEKPKS